MAFLIILLFMLWVVLGIALIKPEQFKAKNHAPLSRQQLLMFGGISTLIIIFLMLVIPSNGDENTSAVVDTPVAMVNNKKDVTYHIVNDESKQNIFRKVNVELEERISEKDLSDLAYKIQAMDQQNYERTLIMYRIKGEKSLAAWATTHFDPDLEVNLIGLDARHYRVLLDNDRPFDGELVGEWYGNTGSGEHIIVIYKKDGKYFEKTFYNHEDGSGDLEPKKLNYKQGKYSYADSDENWHFLINESGDLEYWGDSGNSITAKKIESAFKK